MANVITPILGGHCFHDSGDQRDSYDKCCWCNRPRISYEKTPGHGPYYSATERRDLAAEFCDKNPARPPTGSGYWRD